MTQVKSISYTTVRDCGSELMAEYNEECGWPDIPANPQWDIYAAMESAGVGFAYGVYVDGELAGFTFVVASILPHNGIKVATAISLFVAAKYRNTDAWIELKAGAKTGAALAGCKLMFFSTVAGSKMEALFGKRHRPTNTVFCEPLA